jgi:hypothetical protein
MDEVFGTHSAQRGTVNKTLKVITEAIPANYRELPKAERLAIARRLARQVRAGLGHGGTISEQLGISRDWPASRA